jgi:uridine kinase
MAQLTNMRIISLEELEENLGVNKLPDFVKSCEHEFISRTEQIAVRIAADHRIKAVFVSGPTSSGKTTFSNRLAVALTKAGCRTHLVSMDDYYQLREISFDEQGRPDFESIDTLDIDLMLEHLSDLFAGKPVRLPEFSFVDRSRRWPDDRLIQLGERDLIIVEGLHGLSPKISGQLNHDQYHGIFIMPWCSFLDGRQLLGSRDVRVLRRISRDVMHRGSTAMSTIDYWPMIERTEQAFVPEYLARADEYINSCLPYEFCVVAPLAAKEISLSLEQFEAGRLPDSIYLKGHINRYADLEAAVADARSLLSACERIPQVDRSIVPALSILNEFV